MNTTRTDKRTTVSLAEVVWRMAEEQMQAKGFNDNFSAYCADLIRRDREKSNSSPSPAFGAIFDASAANAHAAQALPPAPIQPVIYSKPARSTPRKKLTPRKKH